MTKSYTLPELGEGIEEAEVLRVLVSAGDEVERDQPVLEVESDKATVEVPAPAAGRVAETLVQKGDKIAVGQEFLVLEEEGDEGEEDERSEDEERGSTRARRKKGSKGRSERGKERRPDAEGEQEEGEAESRREREEVARSEDEDGEEEEERPRGVERRATREKEEEGEETDEEQEERGRDAEGAHGKRPAKEQARDEEGEEEEERSEHRPPDRGAPVRRGKAAGSRAAERASRVEPQDLESGEDGRPERPAAPSVRRFAREIGVDLSTVEGSDPSGRVSIADIKEHARRTRALRRADLGPEERADEEDVVRRPLSSVRRATARSMQRAWATIPQVTLHREADATRVLELLQRERERFEAEGAKASLTVVLVKVLAAALRAFPEANARLDERGEEALERGHVHVGVAVDTERGLYVPVLHDADERDLLDLGQELVQLAERARAGRLAPRDMGGASATLTNLGGLGIERFTPIVVPGQALILGAGRARPTPVLADGAFVPKHLLPLSLTFDHRLLDGADGARFLGFVAEALEDPWVAWIGR